MTVTLLTEQIGHNIFEVMAGIFVGILMWIISVYSLVCLSCQQRLSRDSRTLQFDPYRNALHGWHLSKA